MSLIKLSVHQNANFDSSHKFISIFYFCFPPFNWHYIITVDTIRILRIQLYTGLEIKKILRSPFSDQLKKYSRQLQIHKNRQNNSVEILSNTCLYNIFKTYLNHRGYLLAVNLQIYLETLSLVKSANNVPKLPGIDYVVKNRALAMMLKVLSLVHFWNVLLLK